MVYAHALGACGRKPVEVQVLFSAPKEPAFSINIKKLFII